MKSQAVVETHYVGRSETKPSRVSARNVTSRKRRLVSWDHALGTLENHAKAAELLLGCKPEWYSSVEGGGYLFGAAFTVTE